MTGPVFECTCLSRDPRRPEANEDRIVVLPPGFAAVIDGATDLTGQSYDGLTGGALAAAAVGAAFAQAWALGQHRRLLTAEAALGLANEAIGGVYARHGIEAETRAPDRRFRAAFASAARIDGAWHLVAVGDCGIRVDGRPRLGRDHPAETVLARLRARLLRTFRDDTAPEGRVWPVLTDGLAGPGGDPMVRTVAAEVAQEAVAAGLPEAVVRAVLDRGLMGMRRAEGEDDPLFFGVADGHNTSLRFAEDLALPVSSVSTIELHSDGYLTAPDEATVAAWEAGARRLLAEDPRLTGATPVVKAPVPGGFHDDRSVVVVRM